MPECRFCGKKVSENNRRINDDRYGAIDRPVCNDCWKLWVSNNQEAFYQKIREKLTKI